MKFTPMPKMERINEVLSYNPDIGEFRWKVALNGRIKIGQFAGAKRFSSQTNSYYFYIKIDRKFYASHRLAYYIITGVDPLKYQVDHKNGNTEDNRFENLRLATNGNNKSNSKIYKNNNSGYKGVGWNKQRKKWQARIQHDGKRISLGFRDTKEEAFQLYKDGSVKYHKEFGRTE